MKKDGDRVVSVMKEYVVEVEDVEMPTPRFSCLVGYECFVDVQLSISSMFNTLNIAYTCFFSVPCMLIHFLLLRRKRGRAMADLCRV